MFINKGTEVKPLPQDQEVASFYSEVLPLLAKKLWVLNQWLHVLGKTSATKSKPCKPLPRT